jgi:hypothetical protein
VGDAPAGRGAGGGQEELRRWRRDTALVRVHARRALLWENSVTVRSRRRKAADSAACSPASSYECDLQTGGAGVASHARCSTKW